MTDSHFLYPPLPLLPFDQLPWEGFEVLVEHFARDVEKLFSVRRYGSKGQSDDGVDVVGYTIVGDGVGYQAKREIRFGEADLQAAVDKYLKGRHADRTVRFVVCTSCEVTDSKVADLLRRLNNEHRGVREFDLYDGRRLSDMIRPFPSLVFARFGNTVAQAFCDVTVLPPVRDSFDDALRRGALAHGPIAALELEAVQEDARAAHQRGDAPAAARGFAEIASSLGGAGFHAEAAGFELARGRALRDVDAAAAFDVVLDVAIDYVEAGEALPGPADAIGLLQELRSQVDPLRCARYDAYLAYADWFINDDLLIDCARAFDVLAAAADVNELQAGRWVAEAAWHSGRIEVIRARRAALHTAVARSTAPSQVQNDSVRLRLAVAEALDDRRALQALVEEAEAGRLVSANAALVYARAGRRDAFAGRTNQAVRFYRQMLVAVQDRLPALAGAALEALSIVHDLDGRVSQETLEARDEARVHGSRGRALGPHPPRPPLRVDLERRALYQRYRGQRELAHLTAKRWRLEASVSGHLYDELDATRMVADGLVEQGRPAEAVDLFLRIGADKAAVAAAASGVWKPHIQRDLHTTAQRRAYLAAIAAAGPLLPVAAVNDVLDRILAVMSAPRDGAELSAASRALGGICLQVPADRVEQVLAVVEPTIVDRPADVGLRTDQGVLQALRRLHNAHRHLRVRIGGLLLRALGGGIHLSDPALRMLQDLTDPAEETLDELRGRAREGDRNATWLLARYGDRDALVLDAADRHLATVTPADPDFDPVAAEAALASVQAEHLVGTRSSEELGHLALRLMDLAEDRDAREELRASRLADIAGLAPGLDDESAAGLFERVLALYGAPAPLDPFHQLMRDSAHPFSPASDELELAHIQHRALVVAGALVRQQPQAQIVQRLASVIHRNGGPEERRACAHALINLPALFAPRDLAIMAASHEWELRCAAAILWSRTTDTQRDNQLGEQLARDPDVNVRRTLAQNLATLRAQDSRGMECARRLREVLLDDPHAVIRWNASRVPAITSSLMPTATARSQVDT